MVIFLRSYRVEIKNQDGFTVITSAVTASNRGEAEAKAHRDFGYTLKPGYYIVVYES